MTRYVFKVFYIGDPFSGFQRQPDADTIENHIETAFVEAGYISSFAENFYMSCARTDKGVSAFGNIFQLDMEREPDLFTINKQFRHNRRIQLWAYTRVADDYLVRPVVSKTYRYTLKNPSAQVIQHFDRVYDFLGNHDFKFFIRRDTKPRVTICNIFEIDYFQLEHDLVIDISGDHFGWNMIRRMMGFLADPRYFKMSPLDVLDADNHTISVHTAESDFLLLKEIQLRDELEWIVLRNPTPLRRLRKDLEEEHEKAIERLRIVDAFLSQK